MLWADGSLPKIVIFSLLRLEIEHRFDNRFNRYRLLDQPHDRWPVQEIYQTIKSREPQCQIGINWTIGEDANPNDPNAPEKSYKIIPEKQKEGDPIRYFPVISVWVIRSCLPIPTLKYLFIKANAIICRLNRLYVFLKGGSIIQRIRNINPLMNCSSSTNAPRLKTIS